MRLIIKKYLDKISKHGDSVSQNTIKIWENILPCYEWNWKYNIIILDQSQQGITKFQNEILGPTNIVLSSEFQKKRMKLD